MNRAIGTDRNASVRLQGIRRGLLSCTALVSSLFLGGLAATSPASAQQAINRPDQSDPVVENNAADCTLLVPGDCIFITTIDDGSVNSITLTNSGALTTVSGNGIFTSARGPGAFVLITNSGEITSPDMGIAVQTSGGDDKTGADGASSGPATGDNGDGGANGDPGLPDSPGADGEAGGAGGNRTAGGGTSGGNATGGDAGAVTINNDASITITDLGLEPDGINTTTKGAAATGGSAG